jgi:hypothetical protein
MAINNPIDSYDLLKRLHDEAMRNVQLQSERIRVAESLVDSMCQDGRISAKDAGTLLRTLGVRGD